MGEAVLKLLEGDVVAMESLLPAVDSEKHSLVEGLRVLAVAKQHWMSVAVKLDSVAVVETQGLAVDLQDLADVPTAVP